jgi:hypothetical protein
LYIRLKRLGTVVHTCNPRCLGDVDLEIVRIGLRLAQAKKKKKKKQDPISSNSWAWWNTFIIPTLSEAQVGGSWPKASLGKKHETLSEK